MRRYQQSKLHKFKSLTLFLSFIFLLLLKPIAFGYQYPTQGTTWTVSGSTASKSMASGLQMRVTRSGTPNAFGTLNDTSNLMSNNTTVPLLPSTSNGLQILTTIDSCQTSASTSLTCTGLGTITIDFLDAAGNAVKVRNPNLHISRIGGNVTTTPTIYFGVTLTPTTSGVTMGSPATGAKNLAVSSNVLGLNSTSTAVTGNCSTATSAGCGSVPFTGTTSQLAFNIGATRNTITTAWNTQGGNNVDGYYISVSVDEDFSDAPSSFNSTQAPSHVVTDLALGSTIDADNLTTLSSTTSPSAVSAGSSNNGTNGDGADEDAISSFPAITTASTSYNLTVPISGASRAGQVCGWIDFNNNNAFDTAERACASFISGATSVALSWTGLSGLTSGNRYVRLRGSYNTTQVQSPTGLADSGEVEDYQLSITTATPDLTLSKSHSGNFTVGSTGNYSFTVSNGGTVASSGTITVTDTLPTGLTAAYGTSPFTPSGTNGANWSCSFSGSNPQTVTCTSSTAIVASGTSVFNFNVNVGASTPVGTNSITNTASVSGGGEANTANNSSSDPTTVVLPTFTCGTMFAASSTNTNLYTINTSTGGGTLISTLAATTAAIAVQPSSGNLYYYGGASSQLYVWNSTTGVNTAIGSTISSSGMVRLAFSPTGGLFASDIGGSGQVKLYEINPSTGAVISSGLITFSPTVSAASGDMVFDSNGVLFFSLGSGLYTVDTTTKVATLVSTLTVNPMMGLAFDGNGNLYGENATNANLYLINSNTGTTSLVGGTGISSPGDLGSCYFSAPTISSSKTVAKVAGSSGSTVTSGDTLEYTITVTNNGNVAATGATFTDAIPAGTTYVANSTTLNTTAVADVSGAMPYVTAKEIHGVSMNPGVIGTDTANKTATIVFRVTVNTSSPPISVSNQGTINFNNGTAVLTDDPSVSGTSDPTVTTVISPDLTIAKSHTGNFTRGGTGAYTLTVSNSGPAATSGTITVTDTLPTGLTVADGAVTLSGTNAANWSCTAASNVITCTSTTAIATSGLSVFSFNVNVSPTAASSVTNSVSVSGGGEATANNTNNSASDPTTTVMPPAFGCSDSGYAIKNAGTVAELWQVDIATGTSTSLINPIIPSSLGTQGANSIGYNPIDGLIYGKRIGTNEIVRIASDMSVQIIPITGLPTANLFAADVSANGIYYLTRTGYTTIERVDVNPSSATYMTRLTPITVPAVTYSDIAINPNDGYAYAVTEGAAPHSLLRIDLATGTVTTIGTVTGGGSEAGTSFGSSWMDSNGNLFFNQGSNGNTYKIAATQTLTTGAVTSTFVSTTTTGINDGAKCNTSAVVLGPNVSLAKSHTGNFTVGSSGTYSFTVTNSGETTTSGTITVTDTLPVGLTVNSGAAGGITEGGTNAANWTCNSAALTGTPAQQTITCTSSTAIAASGTSVFNFAVNVGTDTAVGTDSITNSASVSGGGETDTTNNTATNPTTVLSPDLTIAKSHTGNFTKGSTGAYTLTVGNSGTAATSGTITVTDTLPTGLSVADGALTLGGTNSANWSCSSTSNVITCTSSTAIATSGSSIFSFNVNVALTAPDNLTNTATVSGGNQATANNGNDSASDPTMTISNPPNVELVKSCPSPANCTTAPQLPGTDLTYQIQFTNVGGLAAASMVIADGIPANTDFKVGSATANVATTGLTFVIEYSNNFDPLNPTLATWTYTPVSSGGGASSGYDRNVKAVRWRVTSGTLSNVSPNNTGSVSFVTKIR